MEHKDYKLEIVNSLLREESHVREIAKKLNINHMMVVRKIKELEKENVVDYKERGKNKVYFLKKTIEARSYALKCEAYKLNQLIRKYPSLRGIVEKLQKARRVGLVILFGSYAKGIARNESDIDIYVDTDKLELKKELSLIDFRLSIKLGSYDSQNSLIKEIEKNHVIIKGAEVYYEKNKFFD